MARKKAIPKAQADSILSPHAQILASRGSETSKAVNNLAEITSKSRLFQSDDIFPILVDAIDTSWSDIEASLVVNAVAERIETDMSIDLIALTRWIQVHNNDASAVRHCIFANPPDGVDIIKVLSLAGSQKVVFSANWQIAQKEVVLKKFVGEDAANRIRQRETQTHPLSMQHPNIIETHLLQNKHGEHFLVERRLPFVLYDEWKSPGLQEATNLLRDIASALAFLEEQNLVHGDIKPDNIGCESARYILLDFGICRPMGAFTEDVSPTGSLRTRAPELLTGEGQHTFSSDIWAIGATVFNAITRRFPMFNRDEKPPRISHPDERNEFEAVLANRVHDEWDKWVDLSIIPVTIRPLLVRSLDRNPESRIKASELTTETERELSALLFFGTGPSYISPSQEIEQLKKYLPNKKVLNLLPETQRRELRSRIDYIKGIKGLTPEMREELTIVESRLP